MAKKGTTKESKEDKKSSKSNKEVKRSRDAGSGQYVTKEYAEKHPKTTVTITEKKDPGRDGGPGIKKNRKK